MKRMSVSSISGWILLLLPGVLYAGWTPQNSGVSVTLRDVRFVDSRNGYCVGDSGVILHTSDGGTSWARQTSGTNEHLRAVSFPDLSNGWAVGEETQEVLLKTSDGGSTWVALSSGYGLPLGGVSFTDPRNGWVSGAVQDANYEFYALRTSDGGTNWTFAKVYPPPGIAFSPLGGLTRIFAKDSNHAWVGGGDILYIPYPALKPPLGILCHSYNGASWKTDIAWYSQFHNPYAVHPWLFGVHFPLDTLRGWACGTVFDSLSGQPLEDGVFHTGDGVDWTLYYTDIVNAKGFYGIYFTNLVKGWVVGGQGTILRTTNGGTVWNAESSGVSADLYGVDFVDTLNGWACGGNGTILKYGSGIGVETSVSRPEGLTVGRMKANPNPFSSFTTIPGYETQRFALYDLSGRLVGTYRGNRVGEGLSPGVYFLREFGRDSKPLRIVKVW